MKQSQLCSCAASLLDIDDAGGRPLTIRRLADFQRREGRALWFAGGRVTRNIDILTRQLSCEPGSIERDGKLAKDHPADRHLIDYGVQPFDEKELDIGGLTLHLDKGAGLDRRIRDRAGQGQRCLFESLGGAAAKAMKPDVGIMWKIIKSGAYSLHAAGLGHDELSQHDIRRLPGKMLARIDGDHLPRHIARPC
jgi:hypothetical protein